MHLFEKLINFVHWCGVCRKHILNLKGANYSSATRRLEAEGDCGFGNFSIS